MSQAFNILVPDFQYADDGVVEREAAGTRVTWRLFREHVADRIPAEVWQTADAVLCWHGMPMDAGTVARLFKCRQIVRCGVGFDHIDIEAAGRACRSPRRAPGTRSGSSRRRGRAGVGYR